MHNSGILKLLLHGNQLKRTARSGWIQRGVADAEDVAAHSYGVTFTALILAKQMQEPLDLEKIMIMSVLHDLPEGITTDIPSPAWRYLPAGVKADVERKIMAEIFVDFDFAEDFFIYWEELNERKTKEALLVHDADKLEMYLQAYVYEQHTGNRQLKEFWEKPHEFHYQEALRIFQEIKMRRDKD